MSDLETDPRQAAALMEQVSDAIRHELDEYTHVSSESVYKGVSRSLTLGLRNLIESRMPDEVELYEISAVAAQRAKQGVGLASVLAGYRVGARVAWAQIKATARARGVTDSELMATTELLWSWLDEVTLAAARTHREVELQLVREDQQRIVEALTALLVRSVTDEELAQTMRQLDLDPDTHYMALCARPGPDVAPMVLRDRLHAAGDTVVAVVEDWVLGLASSGARLAETASVKMIGTIGIGPAVPPAHAHDSYLAAQRAMFAATALGRTGVHTLAELRLAATAATDHTMTEILRRRLVEPLRTKGSYGNEVWHSVITFLEHQQRIEQTAAAMHIHPNTLRHRLATFTELTGADLRNPSDLAEVWWLRTLEH